MENKTADSLSLENNSEVQQKNGEVLITVLSTNGREIPVSSEGVDLAYEYAQKNDNATFDPKIEKQLVRKIDWMVLPLIVGLMACQFLDKTTISYASIMGIRTDLNMVDGQMYSWVGSSFYFGYLVFQPPANRILQKFPIVKTLGVVVILWGIILCCHSACRTAPELLVVRVLLGCCEAFMFPAYILLTAQWYKKDENFLRSSIYIGFQGLGSIFGSSLSYGLYIRSDEYSIPSWKILFIVTGVITILLGAISLIHLPNTALDAWFLNDEQKSCAVERIRTSHQGFGNSKFKFSQLKETLLDIRAYLVFIYAMSYCIPNGGFGNFSSILLSEDFGFSTGDALLMGMCGGAIDMLTALIAWVGPMICKSNLIICLVVNSICLVGTCLLAFSHDRGAKLFGYLSFYLATVVLAGMSSYNSINFAGTTKKSIINIFYFVGYCAGNIVGPQTYRSQQAPQYIGAKVAMVVAFIAGNLSIAALYLMGLRENHKRDKVQASQPTEKNDFLDLTDKENINFRYTL
ncbi:uncharacterized protein PRCAT00003959001 [Priceomyces carsonii]|uniref:uncharacterized protein n=1 Tax=Priceomyces carsonii TaxID=28549 RepID=UPI002EDB1B17|nr:unnamed protein product [Priceomyces carsonii]